MKKYLLGLVLFPLFLSAMEQAPHEVQSHSKGSSTIKAIAGGIGTACSGLLCLGFAYCAYEINDYRGGFRSIAEIAERYRRDPQMGAFLAGLLGLSALFGFATWRAIQYTRKNIKRSSGTSDRNTPVSGPVLRSN